MIKMRGELGKLRVGQEGWAEIYLEPSWPPIYIPAEIKEIASEDVLVVLHFHSHTEERWIKMDSFIVEMTRKHGSAPRHRILFSSPQNKRRAQC